MKVLSSRFKHLRSLSRRKLKIDIAIFIHRKDFFCITEILGTLRALVLLRATHSDRKRVVFPDRNREAHLECSREAAEYLPTPDLELTSTGLLTERCRKRG